MEIRHLENPRKRFKNKHILLNYKKGAHDKMTELKITTKMKEEIQAKQKANKKLNELIDQCTAMEIKERNKRASLLLELTNSGEKMTEKVKTAKADELLKSEMGQITHLKKDIGKIKRDIEIHNDNISLYRNMIRELQIINSL